MYIDLFQEPGCPPASHSFMTMEINFATVAVQEAVLVHYPVFEPHSSFLQQLVLFSVTVLALCYLLRGYHSSAPHPYVFSANVLSVCHCLLLFSPDSVTFHWAPVTGDFSVTLQ